MKDQVRATYGNLDAFFAERRGFSNRNFQHERLSKFFEQSRKLGLGAKSPDPVLEQVRGRPNAPRLSELLSQARPLLSNRNSLFRYNPWEMSGLGRYEVRNSAVLGQLFDRSISPEAGPRFLARYFYEVSKANRGAPLPDLAKLDDYRMGIENCPLGQQSERVDLTVEGKGYVIGIEIKIDAGEGPEQLDRYIRVIRERAAMRNCHFHPVIFLSPRPSGRGGDILESSWRHVGIAARGVAQDFIKTDPRVSWLLACFAEHVRKFY